MRITILLLAFPFFSCKQYQYFIVSTDQPAVKDHSRNLVFETDSLKITYRFNGKNGPVDISIFNKTGDQVEIDWQRSALIVDSIAYGYYSPTTYLRGHRMKDTIGRRQGGMGQPRLNASIYADLPYQYIPPVSAVSKIPLRISIHFIDDLLKKQPARKFRYGGLNYGFNYKTQAYQTGLSPLSFRSYLTIRFVGKGEKTITLDHHFYASEIWQSERGPSSFPKEVRQRGDFFYVKQIIH